MYAHRLAKLYMDGELPPEHTDHGDGNKTNNRYANLAAKTPSENGLNRRNANKNSTTGALGVSRGKRRSFRARLTLGRKEIHLGSFATKEEAAVVYAKHKASLT